MENDAPLPPARPRRWVRRTVIGLAALLALVLVAPFFLGPLLRKSTVAAIEKELDAKASVRTVSFRWPAHVRVHGLELTETSGEPLASIDDVSAKVALLPLLKGSLDAEIDVLYPELHVRRDPDGRWNWERVLGKRAPEEAPESPDEEEGNEELPSVRAVVHVRDGEVAIHGVDGDTRVGDIRMEATVDGLDRPAPFQLSWSLRGPDGPAGRVAIEGSVTAAEGGRMGAEGLRGNVALELSDVDLAGLEPAIALVAPVDRLAGRLAGRASAELGAGLALQGKSDIALRELALFGPLSGTEPVRVTEVRLLGEATQGADGAGTQRLELGADDFLALAYSGSSTLPPGGGAGPGDVGGTLTLTADLGRLTELARAWVPIQEGVRVAGRLHQKTELAAKLDSLRPVSFEIGATGGAEGLAASDASGKTIDLGELALVALDLQARGDLAAGTMQLEELVLRAGPVDFRAHASIAGLATGGASSAPELREGAFRLEADLEALRGTLAKLVQLEDQAFGGRLSAHGTLKGDAEALDIEAAVDGSALAFSGSSLETLRGELSGRWQPSGELAARGTLELGPIAVAATGAEPLRVPGASVRMEAAQDAARKGSFSADVDVGGGALNLDVRGDHAESGAGASAANVRFELRGKLEPLLAIAGDSASSLLALGLGGELAGSGELHATLSSAPGAAGATPGAPALARASAKLGLALSGLTARDAAGKTAPLGALANVKLDLEADVDGERAALDLRSLALDAGALQLRGSVKASGLPLRPEASAGALALDSARFTLDADLRALGADLARLVDMGGKTLDGSPLHVELDLTGAESRMEARAKLGAAMLALNRPDAAPLVQQDLAGDVDVVLDRKAGSLDVRTAKLSSRTAELALDGKLQQVFVPAEAHGKLQLRLDSSLERLLTDLGIETEGGGRKTSGRVHGAFDVAGDQGSFRLDGSAKIDAFRLELAPASAPAATPAAPMVIEEPAIELACAARMDLKAGTLDLERLTLESGLVRGGAHGRVLGLVSNAEPADAAPSELHLAGWTGDFVYIPERVGAVLAPLLPGKLTGAKEERIAFTFDGPVGELDLSGILASSDLRMDVGIGHFVRPELELDGTLAVAAQDGKTQLRGDLRANGGTLQLDGALDLGGQGGDAAPRSTLGVQVKDVRANSGLAPILGLVHPAFGAAQVAQGTVDGLIGLQLDLAYEGPMTLAGLKAGWASLPKEPIHGTGRFELRSASLRGSPLLALLSEFGVDAEKSLDLRPIEFTIEKGRLFYAKPWTWTLSGTETTFTGSIGLDQTLDLAWNVPISDALVERWSFLSSLKGELLSVPLRGTVTRPKLEADELLKGLAAKAAEKELGSRLGIGGGGGSDDPAKLLEQADDLWDKGKKADAAAIYQRLRDDFKLSLVYVLNKDRIKDRAKHKETPK